MEKKEFHPKQRAHERSKRCASKFLRWKTSGGYQSRYACRARLLNVYMRFLTACKRHTKKTSRRLLCNTKWHFGDKAVCAHEADRSTRQSVFCHIFLFFIVVGAAFACAEVWKLPQLIQFPSSLCVSKQTRSQRRRCKLIEPNGGWAQAECTCKMEEWSAMFCACVGRKIESRVTCRRWATVGTKLRRKT